MVCEPPYNPLETRMHLNKVSFVMGCDDSWLAKVPSVAVFSFSFSEAVHTTMHTMYTTKQAVARIPIRVS